MSNASNIPKNEYRSVFARFKSKLRHEKAVNPPVGLPVNASKKWDNPMLPIEIWLEIMGYLEPPTLKALSLSCHGLRLIALGPLFKSILNPQSSGIRATKAAFRNLSNTQHLHPHIHHLSFIPLPEEAFNDLSRSQLAILAARAVLYSRKFEKFSSRTLMKLANLQFLRLESTLMLSKAAISAILWHPTLRHLVFSAVTQAPIPNLRSKDIRSAITILELLEETNVEPDFIASVAEGLEELRIDRIPSKTLSIALKQSYPKLVRLEVIDRTPSPETATLIAALLEATPTIKYLAIMFAFPCIIPSSALPQLEQLQCRWKHLPSLLNHRKTIRRLHVLLFGGRRFDWSKIDAPSTNVEELEVLCIDCSFGALETFLPNGFFWGLKRLTIRLRSEDSLPGSLQQMTHIWERLAGSPGLQELHFAFEDQKHSYSHDEWKNWADFISNIFPSLSLIKISWVLNTPNIFVKTFDTQITLSKEEKDGFVYASM